MSGKTMLNNFATTVATPRKCVERDAPSIICDNFSSRSADYPYAGGQTAGPRPGTFLTRLDPTGSKLVWSVQQGGNLLAFDSAGSLIVGGSALPAGGMPYQALLYRLEADRAAEQTRG